MGAGEALPIGDPFSKAAWDAATGCGSTTAACGVGAEASARAFSSVVIAVTALPMLFDNSATGAPISAAGGALKRSMTSHAITTSATARTTHTRN